MIKCWSNSMRVSKFRFGGDWNFGPSPGTKSCLIFGLQNIWEKLAAQIIRVIASITGQLAIHATVELPEGAVPIQFIDDGEKTTEYAYPIMRSLRNLELPHWMKQVQEGQKSQNDDMDGLIPAPGNVLNIHAMEREIT
ncbi:hypothetical protein Nepgr_032425 [Nepenthes gracilis]|uniref:Uncharacterized protein n=1 Tax=Nepenthes gracilis TaxID=150966 RepID=A0AAD3Y5N3_NEPGR|nr:hypothetical protein Nepgr_032425 [Nepenthes gracilis]